MINSIRQRLLRYFTTLKNLSRFKKIVIAAVVLIAIFFVFNQSKDKNQEPSYKFQKVKQDTIVNVVSETGEIMTSGKTDVSSSINGIVEELYVDNNDVVKKGQGLYKVNSTATDQQRAKAYSDYLKAKADLETAKANQYGLQADMFEEWDEFKELAESDDYEDSDGNPRYENRALPEFHIPEKEWLEAESKYINQEQVIAQNQAALNNAWLLYQATTDGVVTAPADGTIANLSIAIYQYVDISTTSLVIDSKQDTWIKLSLNEADISTVKKGQKATISVDVLKNEEFVGIVERVDEFGSTENGIVTYGVYLSLSDPKNIVKPGMTVQAGIETQRKENVLIVPNGAIKPYQGSKAVQIKDKKTGQVLYQPIKVGIVGTTTSEVISGLKEGQEIIVSQTQSEDNAQQGSSRGMFGAPH